MKRPVLTKFLAIINNENIGIRASVALLRASKKYNMLGMASLSDDHEGSHVISPSPIKSIKLLSSNRFRLKIVGITSKREEVFNEDFESDSFGNFSFRIPITSKTAEISILQVYEVSKVMGLLLNLGSYMPLRIATPKKLVISDFDRTLIETKYSSLKEIYQSLTQSLDNYGKVDKSVQILKSYIDQGYHPFILSASPHFYENSIRDWLYRNGIYTAAILLKDYREALSYSSGLLAMKDIGKQGLYKFNNLLEILGLTGIPDELILMGDNFESDPAIYLLLSALINEDIPPWTLWNRVKTHQIFKLTQRQHSYFLNKIYQLKNMIVSKKGSYEKELHPKIKIYIRKKSTKDILKIPHNLFSSNPRVDQIELYDD
ncbi:MAG: hypothetical protein ISR65_09965 [Bacteriovoracaceae bacterium]|nr:hypothetical protein [Bacteriovoracaceae bacterium]